jgi:hypothetical protein
MEAIKIKPRIKKVQKKDEPVTVADGSAYVPLKIEGEKEAMRACLHMILKHTADMFVTICEIVAEEYKLDSEQMVKTIQSSPRYENLCADDVLLTLGYLDAEQVGPKAAEPQVEEPQVEVPKAEDAPKPKRKPRAPKTVAPPPLVPAQLLLEDATPPSPVSKKVKVRIINKK